MLATSKRAFRAAIICAALAITTVAAEAKRLNPKTVAPVVANGIGYSAEGDGRDQYVVATDAFTGKELWRAKVFHTRIKFWIEEDVQWVFITDLKIVGDLLFVRDERARCHSVDIKTHRVHKAACDAVFAK